MNILILMAGDKRFSSTENYPLSLIEIDGAPLIERLVQQCHTMKYKQLIFAMREEDVKRYHLDQVVHLLDKKAEIVIVEGATDGATCTALLAAGFIDNDSPLLVLNADELLNIEYQLPIDDFQKRDLDGGTLVFRSIHPRYSFVQLDDQRFVVEAAEKNPISQYATAGFYYFKHGADFINGAKQDIRKDARQNGAFYVCPTFNQLILDGKRIGVYEIDKNDFHPLKTDRQLEQYSLLE